MPEVRVDPLSGLKVVVAGERASRPGGGPATTPAEPIDPETDPFLEGHEDRTPPELYRAGGGEPGGPGWSARVVPNLYPALAPDAAEPPPFAKPDLFAATPARGAHEVIVVIMLNNIEEIGKPQVIAGDEVQYSMLIPPMKVRDFNFTSLSDAV